LLHSVLSDLPFTIIVVRISFPTGKLRGKIPVFCQILKVE
jgi:hypothetical protein